MRRRTCWKFTAWLCRWASTTPTRVLVAALGVVTAASITVAIFLQSLLIARDGGLDQNGEGFGTSADNLQDGDLHFAWVSDCSQYQEWQSMVLMWSIYKHQGPATAVTRLISGCSQEEADERRRTHSLLAQGVASGQRSVPPTLFFTEAHVHDEGLNDTYPPYNRPYSIAKWVAQGHLRASTHVVLLDPDMVMLAPLSLPRPGVPTEDVLYRGKLSLDEALALPALAQRYRYMAARWPKAELRLGEICEPWARGCLDLTDADVEEFFSVGPPWIVTFRDLQRAAPLWLAYVPRVRQQYRQLIAEMYAYILAFASIDVRHAVLDHFVVSYPNAPPNEHAWTWVEKDAEAQGGAEVCGGESEVGADAGKVAQKEPRRLPTFLHYCEIYQSETWYFRKREVPHDQVLSCSAPLFAEPGPQLLDKRIAEAKGASLSTLTQWDLQALRQAWFLCTLLSALNEAVSGLRGQLCHDGVFNASKSLRVPFPKNQFWDALQDFFKTS